MMNSLKEMYYAKKGMMMKKNKGMKKFSMMETGGNYKSKPSNRITKEQSEKFNVPVGTKYSTTVEKPKVRQTLAEYTTPPTSQAEANRYQQLKSAATPTKMMKSGGNWIKKAVSKNPGSFTAQAKRAGMSTSAFRDKVLSSKKNFSSTTVKRAQLAKTLSKMKK